MEFEARNDPYEIALPLYHRSEADDRVSYYLSNNLENNLGKISLGVEENFIAVCG